MASSLLTTDRRWGATPARKSGMTVLGKVPKPINLPSQRLENNGLDPNLELVPKGTLTWGSKAPSTTPNAWGSSSILSTKNNGSSTSSSHFNGRPSSGGGSRPSTAGSESLGSPNAWGPNSRPSSASGTFPSPNQPMASNRPRSAETRPGSSQLSRFADNGSDNVKASIRTIDRSGSSSHGPGFTLSTGDFPTLGSEANSQRGHSSKGRPTSSSGKVVSQGEQVKSPTTGTGEVISPSNNHPVDIMKTEQHAHTGGAPVPATSVSNEGLQPQPYPPNFPMPPPQFDSWRAPPGHPPEGMWHRGPVPGGPYRPVSPPGSFPVEPFGYYGQFPPNSEAARQGPGHGGYHAKNGDGYHPMAPNSYIMNQPVIPVRPVYQGPVPYDGYYGPRPNFNNANVRDTHFIGGPHQPGILNQFPNQNDRFHPGHPQNRPGKHEMVPREQLESDKVHVFRRGQPGSLHDNPDRLGGSREFERNVQRAPPLLPHPDGNRTDMNMSTNTRDTFGETERTRVLTNSVPNQRGSVGTEHLSVYENAHSHHRETVDGTLRNKLKEDSSIALDQQPVIKKNAALIEKIESLNNKARNVDARNLPEPASSKEFKKHPKSTDVSSTGMVCASDQAVSVSHIAPVAQRLPNVPIEGTILGPAHSQLTEFSKSEKLGDPFKDHVHRRGDSSRNGYHGPSKERSANKFGSHGRGESSTTYSADLRNNIQHVQQPESASQLQPLTVPDDMPASLDYESQRTKMKELAAERAKKLKAEEEERIKNQKAKALAKLEELNRRSSVLQKKSIDTKVETNDAHDKQQVGLDGIAKLATSTAEPRDIIAPNRLTTLLPLNDPNHTMVHVQSQSTAQSHASDGGKDPDATSSSVRNTPSNMEHVVQKSISQSHDISVVKTKQGYRKRHVVSEEKISAEKASASITTGNVKKNVDLPVDTAIVAPHDDPPVQNKKGTRHLRSKKKVDDAPVSSKHPPVILNEQNTVKVSTEPKAHTGGVIISSSIVPTEGTVVTVGSITVGSISLKPMNQECVKPPDGTNSTESSRPRPQQARKSGKHQHVLRPVEKPHGNDGVLWAPVKAPLQNEQSDGAMPNAAVADLTQQTGKAINDGENVTRAKRAEMERYVPKPMSKELQQQNPSHDKEAIDKPSAAKSDVAVESKKTSKGHGGKANPSWRKRNPNESALVAPDFVEHADSSYESKEVQKCTDRNQPVELGKQDTQLKSNADAAENSSAPAQTVPLSVGGAKEHSAANRQRRQHVKAQRNEASSYSNESKSREGKNDVVYQSETPVMDSSSSSHRNVPRSDVKSTGVVSHSRAWKPKANSHPQNSSDGKIAVEGPVESHGGRLEINMSKESDTTTHQDTSSKPMKRTDGADEVSHSKQENLSREDVNQKSETEQEQGNPALRRQGQPNARYHRGGGAQRGSGGYDAGRPSHGTNAERRRGGSHLEYQPVGSQNKATDVQQSPSMEERTEGPPASGQAFRERGHNRGPRPAGRFIRRNHASTPTSNSHQNE